MSDPDGSSATTDLLGQDARERLGETKRRCTATNRNGQRCGLAPIIGGFVCALHGGKAPQVQAAARARLNALVDPAIARLERIVGGAPPCDKCGRSDADLNPSVIKAIQIVLDRARDAAGNGFGPNARVDVNHTHRLEAVANLSLEEQLERAEAMVDRFRGLIAERDAKALPPAEAADGYLVPEDEG
jgi:hypothetical protein